MNRQTPRAHILLALKTTIWLTGSPGSPRSPFLPISPLAPCGISVKLQNWNLTKTKNVARTFYSLFKYIILLHKPLQLLLNWSKWLISILMIFKNYFVYSTPKHQARYSKLTHLNTIQPRRSLLKQINMRIITITRKCWMSWHTYSLYYTSVMPI